MAKTAALETEKDAVEKTYTNELEKLRNDVLKMHQQHRDEVSTMRLKPDFSLSTLHFID